VTVVEVVKVMCILYIICSNLPVTVISYVEHPTEVTYIKEVSGSNLEGRWAVLIMVFAALVNLERHILG
jgi:hypothetical protein